MPRVELEGSVPTRTVAEEVVLSGKGIHSGIACTVRIRPDSAGSGLVFHRGRHIGVPADWRHADAEASDRRTVIIGEGGERFEQIEHLMAAFAAMGISDARVEQIGPEVPFLGGGSREFLEALRGVGTAENGGSRPILHIRRPIDFVDGKALIVANPDEALRASCFVEFPDTVVGSDGFTIDIDEEGFFEHVSRARTFALASDIERLRAAGLIKGGDLTNAVVFDDLRYHNEGLHFPNEVVRHKVIDLLGDLALLPYALRGHFWAWRAGHRSHVLFAQYLAGEIAET